MMLKLEDQLEKGKIVIPTDISRDLLIQHRLLSKAVYDGAFSSPSLHLSSHPTSPHLSLHMYQGCPQRNSSKLNPTMYQMNHTPCEGTPSGCEFQSRLKPDYLVEFGALRRLGFPCHVALLSSSRRLSHQAAQPPTQEGTSLVLSLLSAAFAA